VDDKAEDRALALHYGAKPLSHIRADQTPDEGGSEPAPHSEREERAGRQSGHGVAQADPLAEDEATQERLTSPGMGETIT
jgi:hypothetical protein